MFIAAKRKKSDGFMLLPGLNYFRPHAISDVAKHPQLISARHQRIIGAPHRVTLYRVEQKIVKTG